jgi:TnpA family transposase
LSASELIRALQRGSKRSLLTRALGELGRISKTLHLRTLIDDPFYRRRVRPTFWFHPMSGKKE